MATGVSDDGTAMRVITQTAQALDPLPNRPDNPLIVRGGVTINGSATVVNQEGFSTIWSGNDVQLTGSGSATFVPDPNATTGANPYPSCIDVSETCATVGTSLNVGLGLDVIENDDTLGDLSPLEFFMNFFGTTPTNYLASMVTMRVPASAIETVNEVTSEVIWVDADPSGPVDFGTITVGCTEKQTGSGRCPANQTRPSIIIIDDDVDFSGTPHIYGLLFVRGSADMGSNTSVYGAAVIEGDTAKTGGSLNVWYNGSLLEQTSLSGASAGGAGSWKDWD
jgi:hypothetical protein